MSMDLDLPSRRLPQGTRLTFKYDLYADHVPWSRMHGLSCTVVEDYFPIGNLLIAERPFGDTDIGIWPRYCFVLDGSILDHELYDDVMRAYDAMQALGGQP